MYQDRDSLGSRITHLLEDLTCRPPFSRHAPDLLLYGLESTFEKLCVDSRFWVNPHGLQQFVNPFRWDDARNLVNFIVCSASIRDTGESEMDSLEMAVIGVGGSMAACNL